MSVDRVTNPADNDKTGNIWVRDPILSYADGFTMEVNVELKANSEANAFSMTYLDDGGSFGVQLSPDSIKVGGLAPTDPGNTVTFNTTDAFHTYWMEQLPNSHTVLLYVDGVLVDTGQGNSNYAVGSNAMILTYPLAEFSLAIIRTILRSTPTMFCTTWSIVGERFSPTQTQPSFPRACSSRPAKAGGE